MAKIRISISPLGLPRMSGEGFSGNLCHEKMKAIEDALSDGKNLTSEDHPDDGMIQTENETRLGIS